MRNLFPASTFLSVIAFVNEQNPQGPSRLGGQIGGPISLTAVEASQGLGQRHPTQGRGK